MKEHASVKLNKMIHQKARLGIMSILMAADEVDFNYLKEQLQLTDGNLSTHLSQLEAQGLIEINKTFIDKKPRTRVRISERGREAFSEYIRELERIISEIPVPKSEKQ